MKRRRKRITRRQMGKQTKEKENHGWPICPCLNFLKPLPFATTKQKGTQVKRGKELACQNVATKQENRTWGHMTMLTVKEIGKNGEKALHKLGGGWGVGNGTWL